MASENDGPGPTGPPPTQKNEKPLTLGRRVGKGIKKFLTGKPKEVPRVRKLSLDTITIDELEAFFKSYPQSDDPDNPDDGIIDASDYDPDYNPFIKALPNPDVSHYRMGEWLAVWFNTGAIEKTGGAPLADQHDVDVFHTTSRFAEQLMENNVMWKGTSAKLFQALDKTLMDRVKNKPYDAPLDEKFSHFCSDLWRARIVWEIKTSRRDKEGKKLPFVDETEEEQTKSGRRQKRGRLPSWFRN